MSDSPAPSTQPSEQKPGSTSALAGLLSGKTLGVQNIEAAYNRAGGSANHTPGVASKLGSQDAGGHTETRQGVGSDKFRDEVSDQRAEPSAVGKLFNNMINGTDRTK